MKAMWNEAENFGFPDFFRLEWAGEWGSINDSEIEGEIVEAALDFVVGSSVNLSRSL